MSQGPQSQYYHSCILRSVPAGTEGISHTGMQTGTRQPPIPPRVKFRGVSVCFGRFGEFQSVLAGMCISAGLLFGFIIIIIIIII